MDLEQYINEIKSSNISIKESCQKRFDNIAKPLNGLGELERLVAKMAAALEDVDVDINNKRVVVCCSDNGVVECGVSQSDSSVTLNIARSLVNGTSSVCVMAQHIGADVRPVNLGMYEHIDGMDDIRVVAGCGNICKGPAMSREAAIEAVIAGINEVKKAKNEGVKIIATGEVGIGNTTTAAAVATVLLDRPAYEMVGRGAGLSDQGLDCKINAVNKAIEINGPEASDIIDVVSKVGGADIAGMIGIFIGGAYYHIPIIMDGVISAVAALCAVRLNHNVIDYIIPSHMSSEKAMTYICDELGLAPVIHGDFHLGEGTGAVAMFSLLDIALTVYRRAAKFDDIGVEQYIKQ